MDIFMCVHFFPQVTHLYGLAIFEDYLYGTNSDNFSVIQINRFNSRDKKFLMRLENAKDILVYHKRTQSTGRQPEILIVII